MNYKVKCDLYLQIKDQNMGVSFCHCKLVVFHPLSLNRFSVVECEASGEGQQNVVCDQENV